MGSVGNLFPVSDSTLSARAIAADVLPGYDIGAPADCRLLHRGVNDIYQVDAGGVRYVMRAYRAAWRSRPEILYELEALLHLKSEGVAVPAPVPRIDGALVNAVTAPEGERFLVLFLFAPGNRLTSDETDCFAYGGLVARIHAATSTFSSQNERFALDWLIFSVIPWKR